MNLTVTDGKAEAMAAHQRGDFVKAERLYRTLLHSCSADAELIYNLGLLCYQTGRRDESIHWLHQAVALAPHFVLALQLLIRVCDESGDASSALDALNKYLTIRPDDADMLNVKGRQLVRLGRFREAEHAFHQAARNSGKAGHFHDLGVCQQWLGNLNGAIYAFKKSLSLGSTHPRGRLWLAQCLRAAGRIGEYCRTARDAVRQAPVDIEILLEAQSAYRFACDWANADRNQPALREGLRRVLEGNGSETIPPGLLNYLDIDEKTISAIARRHARKLAVTAEPLRRKLPMRLAQKTGRRIRLGYLSTDFYTHAVGSLVRDVFACHDRERFEVYGYSLRHRPDETQARIQAGCDVYRNLAGSSAEMTAQSIVNDQIDILIDLAGYTSAAKPEVLVARPAPLQISWLGYLGTSGGDFIDYLIADEVTLPPELAGNYTEHIMRLPHFLPTSLLATKEPVPTREEVGLDGDSFVFCSFNQPYKIDRRTFESWMEILRSVPGARLWIYVPDIETCGNNLKHEASRLGVDPARLVFASNETPARHLARMTLADLALDPFHISGGATTVASLYAGVPVLTLRGQSFLARMGSSINLYLGMTELDCSGPEEYVAKAVELTTNGSKLADLKQRLVTARQTHPFFNTRDFVRSLEEALQCAWARHVAGQPPTDIRLAHSSSW